MTRITSAAECQSKVTHFIKLFKKKTFIMDFELIDIIEKLINISL